MFLQISVSEFLSRHQSETLPCQFLFSTPLLLLFIFLIKIVKTPIPEKLSVSALLVSLTSNPSFKIKQSLFSLQYISMLDIRKVPPWISVCKSFHGLNHYNLHIPYPFWLSLTISVRFLDFLPQPWFCLHLQSCIKSLQQNNTADKTSIYHQFAATEAGFISRFTTCLLYICFYNFTHMPPIAEEK